MQTAALHPLGGTTAPLCSRWASEVCQSDTRVHVSASDSCSLVAIVEVRDCRSQPAVVERTRRQNVCLNGLVIKIIAYQHLSLRNRAFISPMFLEFSPSMV